MHKRRERKKKKVGELGKQVKKNEEGAAGWEA